MDTQEEGETQQNDASLLNEDHDALNSHRVSFWRDCPAFARSPHADNDSASHTAPVLTVVRWNNI